MHASMEDIEVSPLVSLVTREVGCHLAYRGVPIHRFCNIIHAASSSNTTHHAWPPTLDPASSTSTSTSASTYSPLRNHPRTAHCSPRRSSPLAHHMPARAPPEIETTYDDIPTCDRLTSLAQLLY